MFRRLLFNRKIVIINNSISNNNNLYKSILSSSFCSNSNNIKNINKQQPQQSNMSVTSRMLTEKQVGDIEKYNGVGLNEIGILRGSPDIFNGLTIDNHQQFPKEVEKFKEMLEKSLQYWIENKRRGIWLKVPSTVSNLIPVAVENGFTFHHCQSDYVMMTKWIPESNGEINKLPHYTSHFVGCGGVVINDKNEILLITEKQRPDKWKIPGGANDAGEDICATAIREVFEETGVKTTFDAILGFRELHNYAFNRTDIYFICALKPLTSEINIDPNEIALCKWTPLKEFVEIETFPLQKSVARLAYEYCFNGYKGMKGSPVANSMRVGNSFVYHGSDLDFAELKNN